LVYGWCTITCWREPNTHNHQSLIPYISRSDFVQVYAPYPPIYTWLYSVVQGLWMDTGGWQWDTRISTTPNKIVVFTLPDI
jgi:hypothetical protein